VTKPLTEIGWVLRRAMIVIAAGVLAFPAAAAPPPGHVYNLRNIPLGISLTQFRKTPHPDAEARKMTTLVLCTGDPGVSEIEGLALTPTLLQADAKKCTYYAKTPIAGGGEQLVSAPMTFLGEAISPLFLFYRPEGATDYSLAQITFGLSNRRGNELIGLFYRAYGGPASLDVTSVPTTFGSEMSNIRYIWKNDMSSIQLDSLSFVLDQMSVVFAESRLSGDLSDRMTTIERVARIASQEEKRRRDAADQAAEARKAAGQADGAAPADPQSADASSSDAASAKASSGAAGKDEAAKDDAAKDGAGKDGTGKDGTGKDGATKDGAAKSGAAPAKPSLADALPPGSPLAGFLQPGTSSPNSLPGGALPADSPLAGALPPGSPLARPLPGGSPPASSPLAGALPPGSPLAGFRPLAPSGAAP
jgi:hypothetical protein